MPRPPATSGSGGAPADAGRARLLRAGAAAAAWACLPAMAQAAGSAQRAAPRMGTRPIPSSGEALPMVGCGTYIGFDVAPDGPEYAALAGVLRELQAAGGSVLDSSPMYGRAEEITGRLLADSGTRAQAFLATKVWTRGRQAGLAQMAESMRRLRTDRIDLLQVHNLLDWRTQLASIRALQAEGRVRYAGITHYTSSAYDDVEAVLRAERLDFLQINYAFDDRDAALRLLPLAADRGVAVLVNRPFGGGGLLRRLSDRPLPAWAGEIGARTWAQVLLKFVLSHPAVTCVIPGTRRPEHMRDNAAAAMGPLPDAAYWRDKPVELA